MSDEQMADIVALLEALTDDNFDRKIPARVPSGIDAGRQLTGHEPTTHRCPAERRTRRSHFPGPLPSPDNFFR